MRMYAEALRQLLRPLGVYALDPGSVSGSAVEALGMAMDQVGGMLALAEREMLPVTAESVGLDRREALFARRPASLTTEQRRAAIAALMAIDGDSLTPEAVNAAVCGCGIPARAEETDTEGLVRVTFPETIGVPADFDRIEGIVRDIVPCHLEIEFYFRYLTWRACEARGITWAMAEENGRTWEQFQTWL